MCRQIPVWLDFDTLTHLRIATVIPQRWPACRRESAVVLLDDVELLNSTVYFQQCLPERLLMVGDPVEPMAANWTGLGDCVAVNYERLPCWLMTSW